jgi:hypothetical protein
VPVFVVRVGGVAGVFVPGRVHHVGPRPVEPGEEGAPARRAPQLTRDTLPDLPERQEVRGRRPPERVDPAP